MIKKLATTEASVRALCELYGVAASGYYDWVNRQPSPRKTKDQELAQQIRAAHHFSRQTYGSPRITQALRKKGTRCGKKRVARIMKENGLKGAQKAGFKPRTTDSRHPDPISPNLLKNMTVEQLNQVWVGDITYIPTLEGWLYLAAFMDLKSRKIKGWTLRDHMRTELVNSAFLQAVFKTGPVPGLIAHSDRGSQYASREFRRLLDQYRVRSSMSAKGNCYDNAAMESFWATLKTDLKISRPFTTKEEARLAIFDYIEVFYNRQRIHTALGDLSPLDYEATLVA